MKLLCNLYILRPISLHVLTTSYNMNFLDFDDDVKTIIAKHCTSDYLISTKFMSRHQDLQQKYYLVKLYLIMIFVKLKKKR